MCQAKALAAVIAFDVKLLKDHWEAWPGSEQDTVLTGEAWPDFLLFRIWKRIVAFLWLG